MKTTQIGKLKVYRLVMHVVGTYTCNMSIDWLARAFLLCMHAIATV